MHVRYATYGTDGPRVSALGFGVMRLPAAVGALPGGDLDWAKGVGLLRRALELGVNFFDSHHQYLGGHSETAIGKALAGWKGEVVIQTKTPFYAAHPLEHFQRLVEEAALKLGRAPIDYLLFHSMTMDKFAARGRDFIRLTDWAIKQGLVRRRGFSSHDSDANVRAFIDTGEFSAMLLSYNWLNPQMAECLAYGTAKGMGVSVMNPIGGGQLATDHPGVRNLLPGAASSAEVCMRFVMGTPGVQVTLSGMNELAQLEENVRLAGLPAPLTDQERTGLLARVAEGHRKQQEFCTACGYCVPCPAGVDIPAHMKLLHQAEHFGLLSYAQRQYKWLVDNAKSATLCRRCGECEPKCPNKVAIPDRLAEAAEKLK